MPGENLIRIVDAIKVGLMNLGPQLGIAIMALSERTEAVSNLHLLYQQDLGGWLEIPGS